MIKFDMSVKEYTKSFLFGLIQFSYLVTDSQNSDLARKYKHMINLEVFSKRYSCIIRSSTIGIFIVEGKELW